MRRHVAIVAASLSVSLTAVVVADIDAEAYQREGFIVVPNFVSAGDAEKMMAEMNSIVELWDPQESKHSIFHVNNDAAGGTEQLLQGKGVAADSDAERKRDEYFINSADIVSFFLEPSALNESTGEIRTDIPKIQLLNKAGHGLHLHSAVFRDYASSKPVAQVAKALGYEQPVLPQSMYIFKQPNIGEEVSSHQDSSFLFTEPRPTCLGLWLALEDSTLENGCLWARRGSHQEPLRRVWRRNAEWFARRRSNESTAEVPQMQFEVLAGPSPGQRLGEAGRLKVESVDDTKRVEAVLREAGYEPLEVKRGTLVALHGSMDHLSLPNRSPKSRHTFQLHLVESARGVRWPETNWQQYSGGPAEFPRLHSGLPSGHLSEL